jgi:hypothetical protein
MQGSHFSSKSSFYSTLPSTMINYFSALTVVLTFGVLPIQQSVYSFQWLLNVKDSGVDL